MPGDLYFLDIRVIATSIVLLVLLDVVLPVLYFGVGHRGRIIGIVTQSVGVFVSFVIVGIDGQYARMYLTIPEACIAGLLALFVAVFQVVASLPRLRRSENRGVRL